MQIKRFRSQCVVPSSLVAKSLGREAQPYISGRQMVGQNRVIASDRKSPDPHRLGQWRRKKPACDRTQVLSACFWGGEEEGEMWLLGGETLKCGW